MEEGASVTLGCSSPRLALGSEREPGTDLPWKEPLAPQQKWPLANGSDAEALGDGRLRANRQLSQPGHLMLHCQPASL